MDKSYHRNTYSKSLEHNVMKRKILQTGNAIPETRVQGLYIWSPVYHNIIPKDGTPPMTHLKMIYHPRHHLIRELLSDFILL